MSLLGKNERFQKVGGKIGQTRSAIQQTELAHLNPPSALSRLRIGTVSDIIRSVVARCNFINPHF